MSTRECGAVYPAPSREPKPVLIGKDGRVKRTTSGWTDESVLGEWMDDFSGS